MKIRLISDREVLYTTENTEILSIFPIEHAEIQIRRGNEIFFYLYEHSTYNIKENFMEVYLNLIDIADVDESNEEKAEEIKRTHININNNSSNSIKETSNIKTSFTASELEGLFDDLF
ncbi:hypothetical protein [Clostridium sp. UBA1056]|uniref:hypothetical protein n=1 Tax=unclassified Clostridium TaxID=2614128 RepID=UPI0032177BB5